MSEGTKMEYTNGEITVVWKPSVCIHAGECVRGLPEVFKPNARPWVQIEKATSEEIVETVKQCPSGALTIANEKDNEAKPAEKELYKIKASKNGPLIACGDFELEDAEGKVRIIRGTSIALCRCGASTTKPFCDGSHAKIKFFG
ncbi:MAG: (4Fe-4S)-binding protein [Pyrinomonadaceae bacterium]